MGFHSVDKNKTINNCHDKERGAILGRRIWMNDNEFCTLGERREENAAC